MFKEYQKGLEAGREEVLRRIEIRANYYLNKYTLAARCHSHSERPGDAFNPRWQQDATEVEYISKKYESLDKLAKDLREEQRLEKELAYKKKLWYRFRAWLCEIICPQC